MTPRLVGLGECMVEFFAEEPLGQAPALSRSFGGDVLNALVSAARLGASTAFITQVGQDPFGASLKAAWEAEGVDTRWAREVPGDNGVYFISLLPGGEREFTYRRADSAASRITSEQLDPDLLAQTDLLLVSGITQAISASAEATTLAAAQQVHKAGGKVAFDPNYRPGLWEPRGGLDAARRAFASISPHVSILMPSFPADLPVLGLEAPTPEAALTTQIGRFPLITLKAAEQGAWVLENGKIYPVAPSHPARICDSTGAGDAWNGAFLAGLLSHQPVQESALRANQVAAAKLAHRGAIPPRPQLKVL